MEEYNEERGGAPGNKSARGYKVIIILLVIILVGLSVIYYRQSENIKRDFQLERDTLVANIEQFKVEVDNVRGANEQIAYSLQQERVRADSLLGEIARERNFSNARIRQYEKEIGTLRSIMRHYVEQIDSLARINQTLAQENIDIRRQADATQQRAAAAEERASELAGQVQKGSVIRARDITITPLNSRDREVSRVSQAARLRVDFVLAANTLGRVGERRIYVVIKGENGYVLTTDASTTFDFEGDKLTCTVFRDIDYQGNDLPVGIYYNGTIPKGAVHVDIYMDGSRVGAADAVLK